MSDALTCWVVTDGKPGMESQCIGLAEALKLTPTVKRVRLRAPWDRLAPYLRLAKSHAFDPASDPLEPPWPDLLIATGRASVLASLLVREKSRQANPDKRTVTVQIQNPVLSAGRFDLVIAPRHDRVAGKNVLSTVGALHRVNAHRLMEGAARLAPRIGAMPRPYIGVLIGGSNDVYRLTPAEMAPLAAELRRIARAMRASLLITPSRRTGAENITTLKKALSDTPYFLWDGSGDNPYFGILALSNFLIVTADSVNMVSEAVASRKPVYVFDLPGGSDKFERFHRGLERSGHVRAFAGSLTPYSYDPPDDMAASAARVRALLEGRGAP